MSTSDLTRQRLVRAALELFTTQGYGDTTTAQIARKAGVAEGTIYRHFQSKQHLLNELYRGAARWAVKFVREADVAPAEAREKLRLLADTLVRGAAREPAAARLFFLDRYAGLLDPSSREAADEFRRGLEALIAQGKAAAVVRPGAVEVWAAVWLAVIGLAIERMTTKEWTETHAGVRLVIDGAWAAIASGSPDRSPEL